jgi:predicted extracellular nuclease
MRRSLLIPAIVAGALCLAAPANAAPSTDVVISEVYGGGGNTGAPFQNDFVELFNRGATDVSLSGKSVQYASATGTGNFGANSPVSLSGTLAPGQRVLIQLAGGATGAPLPTPDITGSINMSGTAGKVALVDQTTGLACNGGSNPCSATDLAQIRDLVGYGSANFFEGPAAAPTLSNTTSAHRGGASEGCADTDNNAADFTAAAPGPQNRSAAATPCGAVPGDSGPAVQQTDPADGAGAVARGANVTVTFSEPVTAADDAFSLTCGGTAVAFDVTRQDARTYVLDPAGDLPVGASCVLTVEGDRYTDDDTDDPPNTGADHSSNFTTIGIEGLRIRDIQGIGHVSPYETELVAGVEGVVTARRANGFFIQDPEPDSDDRTSEGLFVFTSGAPAAAIAVGKAVEVSGRVTEFRGAANALGLTQISAPTTTVVGDGPPIAATVLGEGGRVPPNRIIDNDSLGDVDVNPMFDPDEDGIDFYETVEGMKVQVNDPYVVGPTASFGEIPVVGDGGRFAGPYTARGGLLAVPGDFNPERIHLDDEVLRAQSQSMPAANVRDRLSTVQGVVDYSFGNFKVQVLAPPTVTSGGLEKEVTEAPDEDELSVGSFNVENLTPLGANPSASQRAKYAALAETLVTRMKAPDIVAVEEIQDNNGTSGGTSNTVVDASQTWADLIAAIAAAGGPTYDYRQIDPVAHQDGGAPGGNIRVGFLFRTDRGLRFVDRPGGTSTTATGVVDTKQGPRLTFSPGRIQPGDDAWLASRKPLAGEFTWRGRTLFAVANHFASKGGDDPLFGHFQPPVRHTENGPDGRHRQATLVNEFVRDLLAADKQARVIVLGDINDFDFSETVDILESGGALTTLFDLLPENERYSYVFEGNSQVLDQILVSPTLLHPSPEYDSVHMNAEFADQTSDHDPQVARLKLTGRLIPQNR